MQTISRYGLALLCWAWAGSASAGVAQTGFDTEATPPSVQFKRSTTAKQRRASKSLGGETLSGELAGDWETVLATVTFPWEVSEGGQRHMVALALPASAGDGDVYSTDGWFREAFFLDVGDGVPRLFAAELVDPAFVPSSQEALVESGQLWVNRYVLYQEDEELNRDPNFYDSYPSGASLSDVSFVTDDAGSVLQVSVDIYDEFGDYLYSVEPQIGDRYNPGFIAYDLEQPDIVEIYSYFEEPLRIENSIDLSRQHFVPSGVADPKLPDDFDAQDLEISVILEGRRDGDAPNFAYSQPDALSYTWGDAKSTATVTTPASGGSRAGALAPAGLLLLFGLAALRRRPGLPTAA